MVSEKTSVVLNSFPESKLFSGRIILHDEKDTISLKKLVPDDAVRYFELINSDREHLSQHGDTTSLKYPNVVSVEKSILHPENTNKIRFGIWDKDLMVGSDNLTLKGNGRAELGSWIAKKYTGNRYASRARRLLVNYAFRDLRLDEVYCEIVVGNERSRRSVERSGFKLTSEHKDEEGVVKWIYTLKKDEAVKV
jgi:RimJ/RimL family protein N-acetyltransferase